MHAEVRFDVTSNTYNSILTVQVVSAGVATSGCLKAGELLLGSREGVHLNSGKKGSQEPASCHHDPVLKFNGTSTPYMKMITIYLQ